jgi:2-polyprenyl-3-methyl-5-hydroxy-6-metoxy-1,4-benzoquinol methylase
VTPSRGRDLGPGPGFCHPHDVDDHDDAAMFTQAFWDERYAGHDRVWSGNPNARLVEYAADLAPGDAIDVGCGEGADVVWLAQRGWRVTGVDVSQVAVDRARAHAAEATMGDRTTFARVDMAAGDSLPGKADLVTAMYLHLPEASFADCYTRMAAAVRPGGTLLVAGHHPDDAATGLRNVALAHLMFTPGHVTAVLDPTQWEVELAEAVPRRETHDGHAHAVTDSVVLAHRKLA